MFGSSAVNTSNIDVDITSFFIKHTFFHSFWGYLPVHQRGRTMQSNDSLFTKQMSHTNEAVEGALFTNEVSCASIPSVQTCQSVPQNIAILGKRKRDSAIGTFVIRLFSGTQVQDAPVVIKNKEHIKEHVDTFLGGGFRLLDDHVKIVPPEKVAATLEDYHKEKRQYINMCMLDNNTLQYAESYILST
jgi:hypothetical protein